MLQVIIVDDEKLSLDQMEYILQKDKEVEVIGAYTNPIEAIRQIRKLEPDLVILDVEMPGKSGLEIASAISKLDKEILIVFMTAYGQYALQAFDVEAVDFMVKPFSETRVNKTLSRVKAQAKRHVPHGDYNRLAVWKNDTIILLNLTDICYFSVEGKKTLAYTIDGSYLVDENLGKLEERLKTKPFFRCYKSYMVNLESVDRIIPMFHQAYTIKIRNMDIEIPVSRHYGKKLKELLTL